MHTNLVLNNNRSQTVTRRLIVSVVASVILSMAQPSMAQTQPKTFVSAMQASQALYEAVQNKDDHAVQAILGAAPELTSTGNHDEDQIEHERFAQKYQEMHRLVREPDGSTVLYIGAENWPFPIPIVAADGQWRFDSDSGSEEVQAREVGENESTAIEVCQAMTKAKGSDAAQTATSDPAVNLAHNLVSSENTKPAASEPFHGYYFRVSKERHGNTLAVAYPAEYGTSGVMTFVVRDGTVYERDLGTQTAMVAEKIQGKPKGKWSRVQYVGPVGVQ